MRLIAIGRLRPGPEATLFDRYASRLQPRLLVQELAEGAGAVAEAKRREGAALLAAVPPGAVLVALDQGGLAADSSGLARLLDRWAGRACFVVGGADGLDAQVPAAAAHVLSLGPLTWPHMLVRVLLAEQLYRAQCIQSGHPYHRPGRPKMGRP